MSSHPPEPLSIEERELAQRLARVGSPGEPSPVLDARILAAAHGAVAKRTTQRSRRERRWPVAFGVAASLALAVGIAWQLRPLPQPPPAYDEAAVAMVGTTSADSAQPISDSASAADASATAPSEADNDPRDLPPAASANDMQAEAAANRQGAASASAVERPNAVEKQQAADAQVPQPVPAPPPPLPASSVAVPPEFVPTPPASAPAALGTPQQDRNESSARTGAPQQRAVSATAAPARSAVAKDTSALDTLSTAEASDEGFDERPPTTASSPEVQQAWLQRIRELIADGEPDAARDSLQEFKRRYPGVALPEDLRRFDRSL